jgi:hypothetical protein
MPGRPIPFVLLFALGCSHQDVPTECTALFAYVTATVVDSTQTPVTGLSISDTVVRTREGFVVGQIGFLNPGAYVVFSDNFSSKIRGSGDSVVVTGSTATGAAKFAETFVFDVPDGCHVQKVSGPASVIVAPA